MLFIRSLTSKYCALLIIIIISLSQIMPINFCYIEKKPLYIIIAAPFSYQSSFYIKYTYTNIQLFCNIYLVFNNKYIRFIYF